MKETVVVLSLLLAILTTGFGLDDTSIEPIANSTTEGNTTASTASTFDASTATSHATETTSTKHSSSATTELKSTHAMTSSATEGPTSTPKPPQDEVYTFLDEGNSYCILIQANISINVNYNSSKDQKVTTGVVSVPSPRQVNVTGNCSESNETQSITISFNDDTWHLKLVFRKSDGKYFQSSYDLQWDLSTAKLAHAPNVKGFTANDTDLFKTSSGYLCMARSTLYANSSVENAVSGIYFEKLHLEAFQNKTTHDLSEKYERCSEDSISNIVPIIVGACLGGLIVIVLAAYLIGRKRSRRGYESV